MNTLKALLAAFTLAVVGAACSDNPCDELRKELIACGQALDCSTKTGDAKTQCDAAKAAATAGSFSGVTLNPDQCEGDIETSARACLLLGPDPDKNCSCA